jgi:hypothetical protein
MEDGRLFIRPELALGAVHYMQISTSFLWIIPNVCVEYYSNMLSIFVYIVPDTTPLGTI